MQRGAVALDAGFEAEFAAGGQDGQAVLAERAGDDDGVARPDPRGRGTAPR